LRAALCLLLLGCWDGEVEGSMDAGSPATTAAMPSTRSCPIAIAGTTVDVDDIAGGAALIFHSASEDVVGLQQRVRYLGDLYELPESQRQWLRVRGGREPVEDAPTDMLPDAVTEMVPTEDGARLEIRAVDPADVPRLRAIVRTHRDQMAQGHCWSWQPRVPSRRPQPGV